MIAIRRHACSAWSRLPACIPMTYRMLGDELVQIDFIPDQPDADIRLKGLGEERFALLNTSPEAHAQTDPIYKVRLFEPSREFPPQRDAGVPSESAQRRRGPGVRFGLASGVCRATRWRLPVASQGCTGPGR